MKFDNCLFRYRKLIDGQAEQTITAFRQDRLYFSTPENFNDPFDNLMYIDKLQLYKNVCANLLNGMDSYLEREKNSNILLAEFGKAIWGLKRENVVRQHLQDVDRLIDEVKRDIRKYVKIICFSEDYLSTLMWSHYAENHTGFLLVYNKKELEKALIYEKDGKQIQNRKLRLQQVLYSDERVDMTEYMHEFLLKCKLPSSLNLQKLSDMPQRKLRDFIFTKSKEWSYEKEWRITPRILNIREEDSVHFIEIKPQAIILGAVCSENNKRILYKIAKEKKIPAHKICLDDNNKGFRLKLVEDEYTN